VYVCGFVCVGVYVLGVCVRGVCVCVGVSVVATLHQKKKEQLEVFVITLR